MQKIIARDKTLVEGSLQAEGLARGGGGGTELDEDGAIRI